MSEEVTAKTWGNSEPPNDGREWVCADEAAEMLRVRPQNSSALGEVVGDGSGHTKKAFANMDSEKAHSRVFGFHQTAGGLAEAAASQNMGAVDFDRADFGRRMQSHLLASETGNRVFGRQSRHTLSLGETRTDSCACDT